MPVRVGAVGPPASGVTVMVNDWAALVSVPPPSSRTLTWIVADPVALLAAVNVRVPAGVTAGGTANRPGLSLPTTTNDRAWAASLAGPALSPVAQSGTARGPALTATLTSAPAVKA